MPAGPSQTLDDESTLYTEAIMALDVAAIQRALRDSGLDGWLLYDFHGSNPIAARLAGRRPAAAT